MRSKHLGVNTVVGVRKEFCTALIGPYPGYFLNKKFLNDLFNPKMDKCLSPSKAVVVVSMTVTRLSLGSTTYSLVCFNILYKKASLL